MTAGVVLAAGEGRRLGGPKALLEIDGVPLVARHVARMAEAGCSEVIVVVRPELVAPVEAFGSRARILGANTSSQLESLAVGVAALRGAGPVLVTPVDLLPARVDSLHALLEELERSGASAVTPDHGGRGGHPVALAPSFFATRPAGASLREQLEALGGRRVRLEVDDASVLGDFDTRGDLGALPWAIATRS